MPNVLANKIISLLEPLVGSIVAQAGLKTQCGKLGKTWDSIDSADLDKLADLIGMALSAFGNNGDEIKHGIISLKFA